MSESRLIDGVLPIKFPIHADNRGSLVALDRQQGLPFDLKRAFYIFNVPAGAERAGHASSADAVFVAVHGSVDVEFDNGRERCWGQLADPTFGFHVRRGVFVRTARFTNEAVFLVLSSQTYDDVFYAPKPFLFDGTDDAGVA